MRKEKKPKKQNKSSQYEKVAALLLNRMRKERLLPPKTS